ncbi:hypothetical protein [Petrocella sp. FN5]|uniref:hypothetical protein n=1 Tax=Petrocella sp. FN5 TaxID=3032002 RepID=UPI0023DAB78C|nr:hypothetical protein [Petrocella sp. FN5]MDF1616725.1 hypothetical protein [Petrocella sp. FN5]
MKKNIEIFTVKGQDTATLNSGCSACNSGCEPISHTITSTITAFEEVYGALADITRFDLEEHNMEQVADKLQAVYIQSGEQLIITASNIRFILSKLAPIVAIDGRLVANNYVPTADELKYAIDHGKGIDASICS